VPVTGLPFALIQMDWFGLMLAGGFRLVCQAHLSLVNASLLVRLQSTRPA